MNSSDIRVKGLKLQGNYSFQYCKNVEISDSVLYTKDAFWETENVVVRDSVIIGEYLGWYSRNLQLINCRIGGTQPLCYAENLVMEHCTLDADADLAFEYSSFVRRSVIVARNDGSRRAENTALTNTPIHI